MATTWRRFYRADDSATTPPLASDGWEKVLSRLGPSHLFSADADLVCVVPRRVLVDSRLGNVDMGLLLAHKSPMETNVN